MDTPLLTVRDVAELLAVPVGRVYALCESRDASIRLPVVRLGRLVRFRREDVEAYIAERVAS